MIRIGIRAHDIGKLPPDQLAGRVATKGLCSVQLALNKALVGPMLEPGGLNPGFAFEVAQAFSRHGVQIAILGCYINPIHPDPASRRSQMGWFMEHLRFARDFGCGVVALESGSIRPDYSPDPANHEPPAFNEMLATLAELVAEAERYGVIVGLEAVTSHTVSTPQKMRRVLDTIASNNLQVVFDPVNLLTPDNHGDQHRVIGESLDLFGERIIAVHAKDYIAEGNSLRIVPAGSGQLDYRSFLPAIATRKPLINVLLEEAPEEAVDDCLKALRRAANANHNPSL